MSKYTTEVRFICENACGLLESKGSSKVDEIVDKAREKVFDFAYPIFDEEYRGVLEKKILKHYYTREIGEETVGLWKLRLNTKLNEIMPYYNKLYMSELIEFNPLYTKNIERKGNRKDKGNVDSNGHSSGTVQDEAYNMYSETPQGGLNGVRSEQYLTNATKVLDTTQNYLDTSNHVVNDNTEDYLENVVGFEGINPNKMLKDYRDTFLNIDMMVIRDLEVLFMQLW